MTLLALLSAGFVLGWAACRLRARRKEHLQARMLSFVAHEINSPLTALTMTVLNFTQGTFGPVPEEHRPWLEMLAGEARRLSAIVGDFRDLLHAEWHGDLRLDRESLSIADAARNCLDAMRGGLERSGIPVESELPDGLPAVSADSDRVGRVITALLAHARKFRISGPIRLSAAASGGGVRLSLSYRGPETVAGAQSGALELYAPVQQGESQVLSGVGLGLGLARLLVRAHGGEMTLAAEADGRTEIAATFPAGGAP